MLPSSALPERPDPLGFAPKDTAADRNVKPPGLLPAFSGGILSPLSLGILSALPWLSLALAPKILINRASVDPGRELNGRSQQSHLIWRC
jgi:hypothetical protein